ncbi:MAG: hypothetical protein ACTHNI_00425 [Cellulosimicrobium cellulans]
MKTMNAAGPYVLSVVLTLLGPAVLYLGLFMTWTVETNEAYYLGVALVWVGGVVSFLGLCASVVVVYRLIRMFERLVFTIVNW